eukprot:3341936-Rhodomonas_salina.1
MKVKNFQSEAGCPTTCRSEPESSAWIGTKVRRESDKSLRLARREALTGGIWRNLLGGTETELIE